MVIFKSVSWKNILSTGDKATYIQLDRSPTTLIVGQNGAGKSTMLDALSFALFGKPHRDIKKAQLVNSINGGRALVEVEFKIGNSEFKVIRGIKPNIFEIWQNGNQINQDSNARDFQKYLEANILKLNHKSFHQIVVLGSSSFIPFMQLSNNHRREVIEDLLDINIFSRMNQVLRERSGKVREEFKDVSHQLTMCKEKITLQRKYIADIMEINNGIVRSKEAAITDKNRQLTVSENKAKTLSIYINQHSGEANARLSELQSKDQSIKVARKTLKETVKKLAAEAKFFSENDTCPTCDQDIEPEVGQSKIKTASGQAMEIDDQLNQLALDALAVQDEMEKVLALISDISKSQTLMHSQNIHQISLRKEIKDIETEIKTMVSGGDVDSASLDLEQLNVDKDSYSERKMELSEKQTYFSALTEMLKDTGIKTKIIKQYLPAMNKLINQHLQTLDFFVSFHIDENFDEVIRSRHRDDFNYASFSEGEKQRIDLALLFTWRQIAKMKNSASTNLLILDETFDSSLDNDGIDNLMKILDTFDENSNVFIISHKGDVLENKFRSKIEFKKEHNFSETL